MAKSSFDATVKESKRNKKNKVLIAFFCLCLVVSAILFYCINNLFFVKGISVSIDTNEGGNIEFPYSDEEMLEGLGIEIGDKLYGFDAKQAQKNAVYNLAYIKEIKLSRRWPSTVKAKIELESPQFYVSVSNELYIVSDGLKVLEKTDNAEKIEIYNLIYLELAKIDHCIVGEELGIGEDLIKIISDIKAELDAQDLTGLVSAFDVRDKFNIKLQYRQVFEAIIGDSKNLGAKIDFLKRIIEDRGENSAGGTIDVSNADKKEAVYKKFN